MKKTTRLFAILLILSFILSFVAVAISAAGSAALNESAPTAQDVMNEALVMKVGSNNALVRGEKKTLFTDSEAGPSGAPYKSGNAVMLPLRPIAEYTEAQIGVLASDSYSISLGGKTYTVTAGEIETGITAVALTAPPETRTFGGTTVLYIALDDVERLFDGFFVTYDASGLIYVSEHDDFVNRNDDEQLMYDTAKLFIYTGIDFRNIVSKDGTKSIMLEEPLGEAASKTKNYKEYTASIVDAFSGTDEFKDLYTMFSSATDNFTHPYIKTNQAKFDELNEVYRATENYDEELKWYINEQIAYADTYLRRYANLDEAGNYAGLKEGQWNYDSEGIANESMSDNGGWDTTKATGNHSVSKMPYTENKDINDLDYGYDPAGGRLNILSNSEACLAIALEPVALAYQITRDSKYLAFAYDWMYALCQWEHWGPGHFLNCANTARPLATAYDWLYNDFVKVYGQDAVDFLAGRIYENAVYEAQISLSGLSPEHKRSRGDSSQYWVHTGNWNPVCTLGMLVASLAVMGEGENSDEYKDEALYVIAASLAHYMERGMTYITLDGGYRESAGYWGAVYDMHMITKILTDTAGTDFGLLDYPGIDTADYFGCQIEGSSYVRWNYHDDWEGSQPSYWYYLSAEMYDNPEYAAIRYRQLHRETRPKSTHRLDLLYYNKDTVHNSGEVKLTLDYSMTSIDATVVHSSFEKNALFAGLMGGMNNVEHGQYDSGNWIYENGGIRWFSDLGSDNYNLAGYGRPMGYYKYSAEGNNTLALTSDLATLPHGQALNAGGELVSFAKNDYGSATVIDQNSVYAGKTEYARRGMLFTDSRNTFVIQDEVKTSSPETFYWFAHYDASKMFKVEISDGGRTAYMWARNSDGDYQTLRVTLLSDNEKLKFEIMDTHTLVLNTPDANYSPSINGIYENPRDNYMKLAVKAEGVTELNMAVVIELVTKSADRKVGYSFVPMSKWQAEEGELPPDGEIPVYTVYYTDGTSENYCTSSLPEGLLDDSGNIKTGVERVECHGNVKVDAQMRMLENQNITLNLNGNLLHQTRTVVLGPYTPNRKQTGSLTVNGGTVFSEETHFQIRFGTTIRFNDVDLRATAPLIRDEGGRIIFDHSTVSSNTSLMFIVNSADTTRDTGHNLVINNSELEFNRTLISLGGDPACTSAIYLDVFVLGDSAISITDYSPGEIISASPVGTNNVEINFHISDGVRLNVNGLELPENVSTEQMSHTYTLDYRTAISMSDGGTVNPGTAMMPYDSTVTGSSIPMYVISETFDTTYPYVIEKLTPTFIAYKKDGTSESFYSSDIALALPTDNVDNGVNRIVLISDAALASTAKLGNDQELTIELSGYNLYSTGSIMMGSYVTSPITCTVKVLGNGGKIIKTGDYGFCARLGTTLIFDNVTVESNSYVLWDNGAKTIAFNGCNVTADSLIHSRYGNVNTVGGKNYHNVVINDSTVNVSGTIFAYSDITAELNYVDLYVLGTSRVSYADMFSFAENAIIDKAEHNVHVEKGALLSNESFLPENTETRYGKVYAYGDVTLGDGYTIAEAVKYPLFRAVEQDGFYTVEFVNMVKGIKSTLTLYADFTVNFYIPVEGNVIDRVIINGVPYTIDGNSYVFTDGGVSYYKLSVKNIAADKAAENIELSFFSGDYAEHKTFSVVKYCEILMSNESYTSSYRLISSVVSYISAAYDYTDAEKPEILTSLLSLDKYIIYRPDPMPLPKTAASSGNICVALHGAQLDLGSSLRFRFNINTAENNKGNAFTGTIYINGVKYTVKDGLCGGYDYITVEMRAFDMYDFDKFITISGISESGEEFSGTYDLRAYIQGCDRKDVKLLSLMSALYNYCAESYSAKYGVEIERPSRGDMPFVDTGI